MMSEGWEALRARRQAILDARDKKDLKKWKARHGPVIELTKPASVGCPPLCTSSTSLTRRMHVELRGCVCVSVCVCWGVGAQILKVLKNAVVDTLQQWQGQRVAVNFAFFTLAYIDSEAAVDGDLCAVGCEPLPPPPPWLRAPLHRHRLRTPLVPSPSLAPGVPPS
jgi:hypothetical protein